MWNVKMCLTTNWNNIEALLTFLLFGADLWPILMILVDFKSVHTPWIEVYQTMQNDVIRIGTKWNKDLWKG